GGPGVVPDRARSARRPARRIRARRGRLPGEAVRGRGDDRAGDGAVSSSRRRATVRAAPCGPRAGQRAAGSAEGRGAAARYRRAGAARPSVLRHADLELDSARREVRRAGVLLSLTSKEFAILEYLMARPDQAVPRAELIEHCWGADADPMSNVVDVVVLRLRRK